MLYPTFSKSRGSRLLATALPAAVLTFGIFVGMKLMLDEEVSPIAQAESPRVLKVDMAPEKDDLEIERRPATMPDLPSPPPPPAKFAATASDIQLDPIVFTGGAPEPLGRTPLKNFIPNPVAIGDRVAQPVTQPLPDYPMRALERGISGTCEVRFDLTPQGKPYNVVPDCSNSVFEQSAKRAVSRTDFLPQIRNGQALEQKNMIFPLVYKIEL
mgnify:CR=1 FL=1